MYADSDLEAAVRHGVLTREAADGFRDFMARSRAAPGADEESFRLLTGFNDIFVTIAIVMVLVAAGTLLGRTSAFAATFFAGPVTACASWGLAEYFTRRRRMALPSIVLLLFFVGSTIASVMSFENALLPPSPGRGSAAFHGLMASGSLVVVFAMLAGCFAAYVHWRRFMVPITVAVGALAASSGILSMLIVSFPELRQFTPLLIGVAGVILFGLAMWWDASDRLRVTRRADTGFWLHMAAAPMIVHPVFTVFGVFAFAPGVRISSAAAAVGCYLLLALVALAVDRRAVLVSSLIYVLTAMSKLLSGAGSETPAFTVAAFCIGTGLLLLSALWQRTRARLVLTLPPWLQAHLPPV
ncbi:MAG TPA: hypothetical protein VGM32_24015 [Rhodopila sp.]|jgi:hypothetical protein